MAKKGEYEQTKCPECLKKMKKHPDANEREVVYICEHCGFQRVIYK